MSTTLPADVLRVFKNTQAEFTGEALKLRQFGVCLNTDQPTLGVQLVIRKPTGEYIFKNFSDDFDGSAVGILDSTTTLQALLDIGKTVIFVGDNDIDGGADLAGTYTIPDDSDIYFFSFQNGLASGGNIRLTADTTFLWAGTKAGNLRFQNLNIGGYTLRIDNRATSGGGQGNTLEFEKLTMSASGTIARESTGTPTGNLAVYASYIEALVAVTLTTDYVDLIYENAVNVSISSTNGTNGEGQFRTADLSSNKIFKQKGYVNPDNYNTSYDPVTRTASVASKVGGRNIFYCRSNLFDFADADSKNSVVLPATERKYFLYRDDNGQLSYETVSNSDDVIRNCTLDSIVNLKDDTAGSGFWIETLIIDRWEDAESNPVENFASYKTKGIQTTENSVLFSGTLNGSTIGHTGGEYLTSRDFQFFADAVDAVSKQWVVYYLNGTDADGDYVERHVPATLGIPYFTTGGALQYNFYNGSTWSAQPVDNQKYVCCHFAVADNSQAQITAILGQDQYANLSTAQNNIVTERSSLVGSTEVFKDARLVGSCIFQNAGGTGELQYADADNNLFSYPATTEVSSGGGSVVVPNINAVMYQDPNKGVVDISGQSAVTRIFTLLKDGVNQLTMWGDGKLAALVADIATLNCFESFTGTSNNTLVNADNIKAGSPTLDDAVMNIGAGVAQGEKYVIDDSNPSGGYDGDYVEDTVLGALFPAEPQYKTYIQTGTDRRLRPIASFNGGPVYAYALSNEVTPTQYSVIHQVTQDPYYQTSPDPDAITGSSYDGTGVNNPYNADAVYVPAQTGESAHFEGDIVIDGALTVAKTAVSTTQQNGWVINSSDIMHYSSGEIYGYMTVAGNGTGAIADNTIIATFPLQYAPNVSNHVASAYVVNGGLRTPYTIVVRGGTTEAEVVLRTTAGITLTNNDTFSITIDYRK